MRDLTECQAFVDHLRGEHIRVHRAVSDVEAEITGAVSPRDAPRIKAALVKLRETLSMHFAEEEEGGCLNEAAAFCPRLAPDVEVVEREHTSLLKLVDHLIRRAEVCETEDYVESFRRFAKTLHAHENSENRILSEAFGTGQLED